MNGIKTLALALAALLACGALLAASASANVFTAEAESVEVVGSQTEEGQHVFSVEGSKAQCESAYFATEGEIAVPTETAELHPEFSGCIVFGFINVPIQTTGCNLVFHAGTVATEGETFDGSVDLICTPGNVVTITAGTCAIQLDTQEGLGGIRYENQTGGEVLVEANVSGIAVNKTKDGLPCPLGGTGETTGNYTGYTHVSGVSKESSVGIAVE
ncbi:MAG: hypothetical protein R2725_03315 [Solirubrobacterales bacterium]